MLKIISTGQPGVEIIALYLAKINGFETGGTTAKEFLTVNGPNMELKNEYGLVEHDTFVLRNAIWKNIEDSGAIINIKIKAHDTSCLEEGVAFFKKPCLELLLDNKDFSINSYTKLMVNFIERYKVKSIFVYGNSLEPLFTGISASLLNSFYKAINDKQ